MYGASWTTVNSPCADSMGSRMELPIQSSPPHGKLCYLGEMLLQSFMGLTFSQWHFSDKFLTSVVLLWLVAGYIVRYSLLSIDCKLCLCMAVLNKCTCKKDDLGWYSWLVWNYFWHYVLHHPIFNESTQNLVLSTITIKSSRKKRQMSVSILYFFFNV